MRVFASPTLISDTTDFPAELVVMLALPVAIGVCTQKMKLA